MRILILLVISSVYCHFGDNSGDLESVGFQFLRKFFEAGNDYGADEYNDDSDNRSYFLNPLVTTDSANS